MGKDIKYKKLKIFFFIPHADGGVIRSTLPIIDGLQKSGHTLEVITLGAKGDMFHNLQEISKVHMIPKSKTIFSIIDLSKLIHKKRPDILISIQHYANVSALLSNFMSGNKTKVIVSERSSVKSSLNQSSLIKRIVIKFLIKLLYKKAFAIVVNSLGVKNELSSLLKNNNQKINLIYNPTYDPKIYENRKKNTPPNKWPNNRKTPVILGVGRLSKEKKFDLLIRSFSDVREKMDSQLIILGDGPEKDNLNMIIKSLKLDNFCTLLGFVENPYDYMKNASILVLSSQYEGLPNVLIEAQACDLPIIATNCEYGPEEILLNGKAGILIPTNDHEAMTKAIIKMLSSEKLQKEYIKIGKENLFRFHVKESLKQYKMIIDEIKKHK